uniref:Uncharacterized protein n=1 Tax=Plectus sambesii TaxID=2011161 RepID=A0A914XEW8_9BILA
MYVTVLITAIRVSKKLKATKVGPWGAVGDATETNDSSNSNIDEDGAKSYPKRSLGSRNAAIHKSIPVEGPYVGSDDAGNHAHQGVEMRRKALRNADKQKKQITASRKMAYDRELRLAVCGFLMFLCMLVYFIFLLGVVVSRDIGFQFSFLWNISSDIVSCISPYTLIIMSKQTRVAIKRLVKCRRI